MPSDDLLNVPTLILGLGGVGQSLLRQILETRRLHSGRGFRFQVIGVADSSGAVRAGDLDDAGLASLLDRKAQGESLCEGRAAAGIELDTLAGNAGGSPLLVVDCTATAATSDFLLKKLRAGGTVVLANKKPLTARQQVFDRFEESGRARWESTVGAGLPLVACLRRLQASGDLPHLLEGTLSSTLGYLSAGLQQGHRFSELITVMRRQGYTEPDPREDLSGRDLARKALILARTLGWKLELDEVERTPLCPEAWEDLPLAEFLTRLPTLDGDFQKRFERARSFAKTWRYTVRLESGRCTVGLSEVEIESPLGRLTGPNQLVQIHSRWYQPDPLVIQGRGAGVHATAAGVLSDMVDLASLRTS